MSNCKYRYLMHGIFEPTDGNTYEINIPSPFIRDSEVEAVADEWSFTYCFMQIDKPVLPEFAQIDSSDEPVIVVFEKEGFNVTGRRCLTWVEEKISGTYTFEQFKKMGGYIRMLKPECKGKLSRDLDDFIPTKKTFADVFPNIKPDRLYYIDDKAYSIEEVHECS